MKLFEKIVKFFTRTPVAAEAVVITPQNNMELIKAVEDRMTQIDNGVLLARVQGIEKVMKLLVTKVVELNEVGKVNQELLVYLARTNDELLNTIAGGVEYLEEQEAVPAKKNELTLTATARKMNSN